jgi:hypothetical protein
MMTKSKPYNSLPKLSVKDVARLEHLLDAVTGIKKLSDQAGFDFLSYLSSLSRSEILDILNYQAPARRGLVDEATDSRHAGRRRYRRRAMFNVRSAAVETTDAFKDAFKSNAA